MDINNELQQINTFVKGMNTDVSDALMDSSQYRYAENVRLATNTEENTGELRLIEGTKLFPYSRGNIKAMTSIRDIIIVITDDNNIWKKDTSDPNAVFTPVFKPDEGDTFGDHFSLVTRWESANNIKLYIADGEGPIMSLNILSDGYIKGKENILSTIDCILEPITTSIYSDDGHLNGVRFLYTYRLYKMGGSSTTLAIPSSVLTLYPDEGGFDTSDTLINKSILLSLPSQTTDQYEYMQIFRIAYVKVGDKPVVDMVYDGKILSSFIDSGVSILEVSYEEFEDMSTFVIFPTVIESKEDYLFAANIQDNVQNIDNKFESIDMRAYSTGDSLSAYDYNAQFDPTHILTYNKEYWYMPGTLTIGGKGDYISWTPTKSYIYIDENNKKYKTELDVDSGNSIKQQVLSLRLNEVYRYGAVLYDETGQHSSVKWIGDIMLGNGMFSDSDIPLFVKIKDGLSVYKFSIYGILFTIDWEKIQQACNNKCKQIEIVRCPRNSSDRITITQGIAGYPLRMYTSTQTPFEGGGTSATTYICPPGLLSTNKVIVYRITDEGFEYDEYAISDPKYLMFSSPEYVYNTESLKDRLSNIQNIKLCFDYSLFYNLKPVTLYGTQFVLIKTDDPSFDFGVPYTARKTTNNLSDFLLEATQGYFSIGDQDTLLWNAFNFLNIDEEYRAGTRLFANLDQRDNYVKVNFSHPTIYVSEQNIYGQNNNITGIGYALSSEKYSIYDGDTITATGDLSFIKNTSTAFLNWSAPLAFQPKEATTQRNGENGLGWYNYFRSYYPIGSSGECILLEQSRSTDFSSMAENGQEYSVLRMPVLSMRTTSNTPYGGRYTVDQSTYSSFGNVIKNNTPTEIFDGDCYPGVFVYNSSHTWQSAGSLVGIGQGNVYSVPLYSDVDLSAAFGDLFPKIQNKHKYQIQNKAGNVSAYYILDKDAYLYNSSYGELSSAITYSAIKYTELDSSLYDTRIFYSAVKKNNEHVDNWLSFLEMDFIDVDSRFGKITNMRLFKDKLLFWLEHASGILSVNERTVLNDIDNNDIVIGSGGVLSRFDYISTVYGMKQFQYDAEVQSNTTQYWWDGHNKEILAYGGGLELIPLTKTKGLTNYINQRTESKHPMLAYDIKYDEILGLVVTKDSSGETLVYNELVQSFSSIYTFMPCYRAMTGNKLYLAQSDAIYTWNELYLDGYSLLFNKPAFPKVRAIINKNNIYTKTFDNITFGGRIYKGSLPTITEWPMERGNGEYVEGEHLNTPMHHLIFTFETPLKLKSAVRGDKAASVDEYDYRLAIPRNGSQDSEIEYGNRMRGKTMQCEIASDYNSTDFSLQYITTKFRMSWS